MVTKKVVKKKEKAKKSKIPEFEDAFKYPFANWKRLLNFWWALIPILGWFAVIGYFKKIAEHMLNNDFKELPEFGKFFENMKDGFYFFLVMLVPMIVTVVIKKKIISY